jgi:tetratricopeptide (TPR) repeat protein
LIAVATAAILGLTIWLGFGEQLADRFGSLNDGSLASDNDRLRNWSDTWPAVGDFGWLGSGLNSYHAVHRMYRHDLESKYYQYAENQYFQTLVEAGWPGLALLLAAIGMTIWMSIFVSYKGNSPRTIAMGITGLFLVVSVGIASIFDFGLYLPANSLLAAALIGMSWQQGHALAKRLKHWSLLRHDLPRWFGFGFVGCLLVAVIPASLSMRVWDLQDRAAVRFPLEESYLTLPRDRAQAQIDRLQPLVLAAPTYWGARRLAELYIHRFRLAWMAEMEERLGLPAEALWGETHLLDFREQIYQYQRIGNRRLLRLTWEHPAIEQHLKPAWESLLLSRRRLPLNPNVHLLLAQVQPALGQLDDRRSLERACEAAPTNADILYVAGVMYLQTGSQTAAISSWRRCLELNPDRHFDRVLDRIAEPGAAEWKLAPDLVAESMIPDNPELVLRFANKYLRDVDEPLRQQMLVRADELAMQRTAFSDPKWVLLVARIKRDLGDSVSALKQYDWLKQLQPNHLTGRFERARLLADLGEYQQAMDEVAWLRSRDSNAGNRYRQLYEFLRRRLEKE